MALTDTQTLEGTPQQLTALFKQLPHRERYRLVEVEEDETPLQEVAAPAPKDMATMALIKQWLAEAPTDPEEIRADEADLLEFKRNMNLPRKEGGMRLHYPEAETE